MDIVKKQNAIQRGIIPNINLRIDVKCHVKK